MSEDLDSIERRHDWQIIAHNKGARPWATMRRAARLARELQETRTERDAVVYLRADHDTGIAKLKEAEATIAALASAIEARNLEVDRLSEDLRAIETMIAEAGVERRETTETTRDLVARLIADANEQADPAHAEQVEAIWHALDVVARGAAADEALRDIEQLGVDAAPLRSIQERAGRLTVALEESRADLAHLRAAIKKDRDELRDAVLAHKEAVQANLATTAYVRALEMWTIAEAPP